jgi:hypothetical protein
MLQGEKNTIKLLESKKIRMEPWRHMLVFPWYNRTCEGDLSSFNLIDLWRMIFTV